MSTGQIGQRVGRRIKIRRVELDMNQGELARALGISQSYLSHLERGEKRMDLELLDRIAQVLRCTAVDLLGEEKEAA